MDPQPLLRFPEVDALEDQKPTALCSVPFVWSFLMVGFKATLFWLESLRVGTDCSQNLKRIIFNFKKKIKRGTSLEVQLLRLCASNAGGSSSVSGQRTRSHMLHSAVKKKQKGREVQEGGDILYLWLIHVNVGQKPRQYCKANILQFKIA